MNSKEHFDIGMHCHDALNGKFDQHVFDAMMYHDGAGSMARIEEVEAARRASLSKSIRKAYKVPLSFNALRHAI